MVDNGHRTTNVKILSGKFTCQISLHFHYKTSNLPTVRNQHFIVIHSGLTMISNSLPLYKSSLQQLQMSILSPGLGYISMETKGSWGFSLQIFCLVSIFCCLFDTKWTHFGTLCTIWKQMWQLKWNVVNFPLTSFHSLIGNIWTSWRLPLLSF